MSAVLMAGVASADVTPDWPVMLGGFGQRTQPATTVLDPVSANALYLDDGKGSLLLVVVDSIAMPAAVAEVAAARLAASTGIARERICLSATHTHSAPLPLDPGGAPGIERYTPMLIDGLVRAGEQAVASSRPAMLRTATARVGFLRNRCTRGEPGSTDDRVMVALLEDEERAPFAVLFGVGCHPVTLGWDSNAVSADYPGVARRVLCERLGLAGAVFVNGTEGDVVPVTSPNRDSLDPRGYFGGNPEHTEQIGVALADAVSSVLVNAHAPRPIIGAHTTSVRIDVNTGGLLGTDARQGLADAEATLRAHLGGRFDEVQPAQMWAAASQVVVDRDLEEDSMRQLMIACCRFLGLRVRVARGTAAPPAEVPVQVLRIGDLALLAVPGEPLTEVGLEWQRRAGDLNGFVIGLANAHLRYLPRASSFDAPGAAMRYETVTAGLAPHGVERILDAGERLLVAGTAWQ